MSDSRSLVAPLAVVCAVGLALFLRGSPAAAPPGRAGEDGARYGLTAQAQALPAAAPLRFAPAIAPSDQQIVLLAVAEARPAARRLVELVAGLVTISLNGSLPDGVAGQARPTDDGYEVALDLGGVYRGAGMRGVRRLVLHELAHVVDDALVGRALEAQLDAATPPGFGCDNGNSGGCAARAERFAESFAKWATGDIGNDLYLGYRVPPPASLTGWGAPLAALTH